MTPERLLIHFKMSPAIGLLQARNAPLVVSFLHQQFKQSRIIAIPHSDHGCVDKVVGDWCVGRLAGGDQVIAPVAQGVIPVRELQLLIRNHETEAAAKRANFVRLSQALRDAEIDEPPTDFATFEALQSRLAPLRKQLQADVLACERQHTALIESRVEPVRSQRDAEAELQVLMQRQGNLPPEYVELRRRMCDELGLSERDLPFAAELIAGLNSDNLPIAAEIAALPQSVRGFGVVKERADAAARRRHGELLPAFRNPERKIAKAA